jgi:hypothetical protein
VEPEDVVIDHRANKSTLDKPGDTVTFTATFSCIPRFGTVRSMFVGPGSSDTFESKDMETKTGRFTRTWDGKKPVKEKERLFMLEGSYFHRLEKIKYANKGKTDLYTPGPHDSPAVSVESGKSTDLGTGHFTEDNKNELAKVIRSEMEEGNEKEKQAIAWGVRNQMIRSGRTTVAEVIPLFGDATGMEGDDASKKIAEDVLKKPMTDDFTGGAFKWFSPKRMPKEGEKCPAKYDCSGGVITVKDLADKDNRVQVPGWHSVRAFVAIEGVRDWLLRMYKL